MNLQTFIADTLYQITAGVSEAQQRLAELGTNARVNPSWVYSSTEKKSGTPSPVEFDVAVTVVEDERNGSSEKVEAKAGLLAVIGLSASAQVKGDRSDALRNESISRIKFTVMLAQPADLTEKPTHRVPGTVSAFSQSPQV